MVDILSLDFMERILIALGGNALLQKGDFPTFDSQVKRATDAFEKLSMVIPDHEILITHGNGPQVGNILIQNETSADTVPPMPLDVCGSMSQGLISQILTTAYEDVRTRIGLSKESISVFTRTIVNPDDPAFRTPSKPIGPFYTEDDARKLMKTRHWAMKDDSGRGWRRLVPSPTPLEIVEKRVIINLLRENFLPVSTGGGGTPMIRKDGKLIGVEAVIDKDLASSVLASSTGCSRLLILTDVRNAYLNYGKPEQKAIDHIPVDQISQYYNEKQFGGGSMGPKVLAAINFIRNGGTVANITSIENCFEALNGESGTIITKS